ncbi:MAG TPA: HRDC domain-containing protein [Candidatus Baltobacteraceae bacterium]|nr:HRDC domain-containing protein [Candidatus Baltobacteraceae bacterium]
MKALPIEMVETPEQVALLCERIARSTHVALDTEFHTERTYSPRLMVVQLAFDEGAVIVDPLAVRDLRPLIDALSSVTVVGHALSSDLKIFADRYDRVPASIFDTQIAAAFLGYGMQISLADLVRDLERLRLAKSQTVSDWSTRPLTPKQLDYLVDDVAHLLPMHRTLASRLEAAGRLEWAAEECASLGDVERYRGDERRAYLRLPGAMRMSRRELAVLSEIVKLRDEQARARDLPPKYIIPDDVVSGLATLRPKRVEELDQLRRLDAGVRRSLGAAVVEAVARAEALPEEQLPERPARPLGPSRDTLAAMMGVLVGEIAREHELPQSLLVPRAALDRVAREAPGDRASFERALELSHWRLALVGDPLWRLLSGELHLAIEGYAERDPKIRLLP